MSKREAFESLAEAPPVNTLRDLQEQQRVWAEYNFPDAEPYRSLLGLGEELGELNRSFLKAEQGIRGTPEEHHAAAIDAVADLVVFLAHFCTLTGIDFQEAVTETWNKVRLRDWKRYPKTGRPPKIAHPERDIVLFEEVVT